ncbi:TPA: DUF4145 domain-containing protein [Candidatus Bathyarchaeota archaeon]|nr:DUF4145 domain-containing protein [Candidatus Bathyarchaeota archaeon]
MSVVLSVRVARELKEEADRLGISLRDVVERALVAEIERRRKEEFGRAVRGIVEAMRDVAEEEFVRAIREWRERG